VLKLIAKEPSHQTNGRIAVFGHCFQSLRQRITAKNPEHIEAAQSID
jgi:hypothetical protein